MKQVEQYVAQYKRVFIFDFDNTKSDRIMLLRVRLKEFGRIFAGRNAIVTASLKTISAKNGIEYDKLAQQVTGRRGLLFSDIALDKLIGVLDEMLPEFREKLLGYAQIAPDICVMDVDGPGDDSELKKKKKAKTTTKQPQKLEKHEVKFIKV